MTNLNLFVTGTNGLTITAEDIDNVLKILHIENDNISSVIGGLTEGPEKGGAEWAEKNHKFLDVHFPHFEQYGNLTWVIRNKVVISRADTIIIFWDGKSAGARQIANGGVKSGKKVYIVKCQNGTKLSPMEWLGSTKKEWTEWTSQW